MALINTMAISAICNLLQLQSANVDRMHDEDVWPCSIPKTRGGPPSGLQRIEGLVAEHRGWSCRASKVELQSIEGGVAERRRWSCRESRVELQSIEGGVEEAVVDRDAWCLELQAGDCSAP